MMSKSRDSSFSDGGSVATSLDESLQSVQTRSSRSRSRSKSSSDNSKQSPQISESTAETNYSARSLVSSQSTSYTSYEDDEDATDIGRRLKFDKNSSLNVLKKNQFDPLRDPALLDYVSNPRILSRMKRLRLVSGDGQVRTSYKALCDYRATYFKRLYLLQTKNKMTKEELKQVAIYEQHRQLQLVILREEYRQRALRFKRFMERKRREATAARKRYLKNVRDYDEMSDDDDRRRQKRVIRRSFQEHLDTKKYLETRADHQQRSTLMANIGLMEYTKPTPKTPPAILPVLRNPKIKKPKPRKPRMIKTRPPLEHEITVCRKLHLKHKKKTKVNLSKLLKRLHAMPAYRACGVCTVPVKSVEPPAARRKKKTRKKSKNVLSAAKLSTLDSINHEVAMEQLVTEYLASLQSLDSIDSFTNEHEHVYETNHDTDHHKNNYIVERRDSGRAAHVVEPIRVTPLITEVVEPQDDELDSDVRFLYAPRGSSTLSGSKNEEEKPTEVNSLTECIKTVKRDKVSDLYTNEATQTRRVSSSSCNDLQGATASLPEQSSNNSDSVRNSNTFLSADSGIQTSKGTTGQNSGPLCQTTNMGVLLVPKCSISVDGSVHSDLSDYDVIRLESQPLIEVTNALSKLAESLQQLQIKKDAADPDDTGSECVPEQLTEVKRALSSISSFLSLKPIDSHPLADVYRCISQLFKLYSVNLVKSRSSISEASSSEQSEDFFSDVLEENGKNLQHAGTQKVRSELLQELKSAGEFLAMLDDFETEGIHLPETDTLLDHIDCMIDNLYRLDTSDDIDEMDQMIENLDINTRNQAKEPVETSKLKPAVETSGYETKQDTERIAKMLQECLNNLTDVLMGIAEKLEGKGHRVKMPIVPPLQLDEEDTSSVTSFSSQSNTSFEHRTPSQGSHRRKRTESPRDLRRASIERAQIQHDQMKTLPVLVRSGSSTCTGIGARPKVPSKQSVEKYKKRGSSSSVKSRSSDRKYPDKRCHHSGRMSDASSRSTSTLCQSSQESCDSCGSSSETRRRMSRNTKKQKKHHREKQKSSEKISQVPSTPEVYLDRGAFVIQFSPESSSPESTTESIDVEKLDLTESDLNNIIQSVVTETTSNLKGILEDFMDQQNPEKSESEKFSSRTGSRYGNRSSEDLINHLVGSLGTGSKESEILESLLDQMNPRDAQSDEDIHQGSTGQSRSLMHTNTSKTGSQETMARATHGPGPYSDIDATNVDLRSSVLSSIITSILNEMVGEERPTSPNKAGRPELHSRSAACADDLATRTGGQVCSFEDHLSTATFSGPIGSSDSRTSSKIISGTDPFLTPLSLSRSRQTTSNTSAKSSNSKNLHDFLSDLLGAWRKISGSSKSASSYVVESEDINESPLNEVPDEAAVVSFTESSTPNEDNSGISLNPIKSILVGGTKSSQEKFSSVTQSSLESMISLGGTVGKGSTESRVSWEDEKIMNKPGDVSSDLLDDRQKETSKHSFADGNKSDTSSMLSGHPKSLENLVRTLVETISERVYLSQLDNNMETTSMKVQRRSDKSLSSDLISRQSSSQGNFTSSTDSPWDQSYEDLTNHLVGCIGKESESSNQDGQGVYKVEGFPLDTVQSETIGKASHESTDRLVDEETVNRVENVSSDIADKKKASSVGSFADGKKSETISRSLEDFVQTLVETVSERMSLSQGRDNAASTNHSKTSLEAAKDQGTSGHSLRDECEESKEKDSFEDDKKRHTIEYSTENDKTTHEERSSCTSQQPKSDEKLVRLLIDTISDVVCDYSQMDPPAEMTESISAGSGIKDQNDLQQTARSKSISEESWLKEMDEKTGGKGPSDILNVISSTFLRQVYSKANANGANVSGQEMREGVSERTSSQVSERASLADGVKDQDSPQQQSFSTNTSEESWLKEIDQKTGKKAPSSILDVFESGLRQHSHSKDRGGGINGGKLQQSPAKCEDSCQSSKYQETRSTTSEKQGSKPGTGKNVFHCTESISSDTVQSAMSEKKSRAAKLKNVNEQLYYIVSKSVAQNFRKFASNKRKQLKMQKDTNIVKTHSPPPSKETPGTVESSEQLKKSQDQMLAKNSSPDLVREITATVLKSILNSDEQKEATKEANTEAGILKQHSGLVQAKSRLHSSIILENIISDTLRKHVGIGKTDQSGTKNQKKKLVIDLPSAHTEGQETTYGSSADVQAKAAESLRSSLQNVIENAARDVKYVSADKITCVLSDSASGKRTASGKRSSTTAGVLKGVISDILWSKLQDSHSKAPSVSETPTITSPIEQRGKQLEDKYSEDEEPALDTGESFTKPSKNQERQGPAPTRSVSSSLIRLIMSGILKSLEMPEHQYKADHIDETNNELSQITPTVSTEVLNGGNNSGRVMDFQRTISDLESTSNGSTVRTAGDRITFVRSLSSNVLQELIQRLLKKEQTMNNKAESRERDRQLRTETMQEPSVDECISSKLSEDLVASQLEGNRVSDTLKKRQQTSYNELKNEAAPKRSGEIEKDPTSRSVERFPSVSSVNLLGNIRSILRAKYSKDRRNEVELQQKATETKSAASVVQDTQSRNSSLESSIAHKPKASRKSLGPESGQIQIRSPSSEVLKDVIRTMLTKYIQKKSTLNKEKSASQLSDDSEDSKEFMVKRESTGTLKSKIESLSAGPSASSFQSFSSEGILDLVNYVIQRQKQSTAASNEDANSEIHHGILKQKKDLIDSQKAEKASSSDMLQGTCPEVDSTNSGSSDNALRLANSSLVSLPSVVIEDLVSTIIGKQKPSSATLNQTRLFETDQRVLQESTVVLDSKKTETKSDVVQRMLSGEFPGSGASGEITNSHELLSNVNNTKMSEVISEVIQSVLGRHRQDGTTMSNENVVHPTVLNQVQIEPNEIKDESQSCSGYSHLGIKDTSVQSLTSDVIQDLVNVVIEKQKHNTKAPIKDVISGADLRKEQDGSMKSEGMTDKTVSGYSCSPSGTQTADVSSRSLLSEVIGEAERSALLRSAKPQELTQAASTQVQTESEEDNTPESNLGNQSLGYNYGSGLSLSSDVIMDLVTRLVHANKQSIITSNTADVPRRDSTKVVSQHLDNGCASDSLTKSKKSSDNELLNNRSKDLSSSAPQELQASSHHRGSTETSFSSSFVQNLAKGTLDEQQGNSIKRFTLDSTASDSSPELSKVLLWLLSDVITADFLRSGETATKSGEENQLNTESSTAATVSEHSATTNESTIDLASFGSFLSNSINQSLRQSFSLNSETSEEELGTNHLSAHTDSEGLISASSCDSLQDLIFEIWTSLPIEERYKLLKDTSSESLSEEQFEHFVESAPSELIVRKICDSMLLRLSLQSLHGESDGKSLSNKESISNANIDVLGPLSDNETSDSSRNVSCGSLDSLWMEMLVCVVVLVLKDVMHTHQQPCLDLRSISDDQSSDSTFSHSTLKSISSIDLQNIVTEILESLSSVNITTTEQSSCGCESDGTFGSFSTLKSISSTDLQKIVLEILDSLSSIEFKTSSDE